MIFSVILLLSVSLVLSGCQGGGCNNPATTTSTTATITGTVYAPSGYNVVVAKAPGRWEKLIALFATPKVAAATGEVKLAGAKVMVINFADGTPYANLTATTDSNGKYTLSGLPAKADVVVVVTANTDKGNIRLTYTLADISGTVTANVDSGSSLASEALCVLMSKGRNLTKAEALTELEAARIAVEAMIQQGVAIDVTVNGTLFSTNLGEGLAVGSADTSSPYYVYLGPVLGSLPADVSTVTDYDRARAFVQDLRNTSLALTSPVNEKMKAISAADTEYYSNYMFWDWAAGECGTNLANIYWFYVSKHPSNTSITKDHLPIYSSNILTPVNESNGGWKIIETNAGPNWDTQNTWLIKPSGTGYTFTISGIINASGTFTVGSEVSDLTGNTVPQLIIHFDTIQDVTILSPSIVDMIAAMDVDPTDGSLNLWDVITRFSCANFDVTRSFVEPAMLVKAGETITSSLTETITIKKLLSNSSYQAYAPITIEQNSTQTVYMLDTNTDPTLEPNLRPVTKNIQAQSLYSLSDNSVYDGTMTMNVDNYTTAMDSTWRPTGTFSYKGTLAVPGMSALGVDLTVSTADQVSYPLGLSYTRDGSTVSITGTVTNDESMTPPLTTVDLTNQNGIQWWTQFTLDPNAQVITGSGYLKKNGIELATITLSTTGTVTTVTVKYNDNNYVETL